MIASPLQVANEEQGPRASTTRSPASRQRKPWQPGERDHLAYEWTRFRGKPQWWVANELGVDQSTVSRIVARYEKWLAEKSGAPAARPCAAAVEQPIWLARVQSLLPIASFCRLPSLWRSHGRS